MSGFMFALFDGSIKKEKYDEWIYMKRRYMQITNTDANCHDDADGIKLYCWFDHFFIDKFKENMIIKF